MNLFLTSVAANCLEKIIKIKKIQPKQTKIAFIANASDLYKDPWRVKTDKDELLELGFKIDDVDLRKVKGEDLKKILKNPDVIFVAGGNTYYLQKQCKESDFDEILSKVLKDDPAKIYIGSSAGSMIVSENIELGGNEEE